MRTLAALLVLAPLAMALRADDVDLPEAAQRVFNEKYKDCVHKTMRVAKCKAQDNCFTVTFEDAKGTKFEIQMTALGEVTDELQEIKLTDLPKNLKDTIKDAYPDARYNYAWLDTRKGQTVYLIGVKSRDNDIVVTLNQDGTNILKAEKAPKKKP